MGGSLGTKNTPVSPHYPIPNLSQNHYLDTFYNFLSFYEIPSIVN